MTPLDEILPDVAAREPSTVKRGTTTYKLREYYCTLPRCRCRKALVAVYSPDRRRVEAVVGYEFDHREPYFLPEDYEQGPDAEQWLAIVIDLIEQEPGFRAQLFVHHDMVKRAIAPPKLPRAPKRVRAAAAPSAEAALVLAATVRGETKDQARFKRLLAKVDALREQLRVWTTERPNIDREVALFGAAFDEMLRVSRKLVGVLVMASETAKLSKRDQKEIAGMITTLAEEVVDHTGDAEMKAIYNRFSRSDFDQEVALAEQMDLLTMKVKLHQMGVDVGDAEVRTVDELRAAVEAQFDAEDRAREEQRARRKQTPRQAAAEARRADEARGADKALQAVFRELAKALHPDRERDPAEQQRKSELMREVNAAYEANDLLALLSLQLRLEQVDTTAVAGIAEERVRHYNAILARQEAQLADELEGMIGPFRLQLQVPPRAKLTPAVVVGRIRQDARGVQDRTKMLRADVVAFADPTQLKAWFTRVRRGY